MRFVFRIMVFNYYICIFCFNLGTLSGESQSPRRHATRRLNFSVCLSQEKVTAFADLFARVCFSLNFVFFSCFYHTALLAALFMRKVAQSTCKIKIIISSCWATAIICAPCAVHITQPRERESARETGKMQMQRNIVRLFVSVCVCVCICGIVVIAACCPIVVTKPN